MFISAFHRCGKWNGTRTHTHTSCLGLLLPAKYSITFRTVSFVWVVLTFATSNCCYRSKLQNKWKTTDWLPPCGSLELACDSRGERGSIPLCTFFVLSTFLGDKHTSQLVSRNRSATTRCVFIAHLAGLGCLTWITSSPQKLL